MNKNLFFQYIKFMIVLLATVLFALPNRLVAQQLNHKDSHSQPGKKNKLRKLGDLGLPTGRRRGGTSRSSCSMIDTPLTALVPGQETTQELHPSDSFLATTISEYPTFWVYVPELSSNSSSGEFILQNEAGEDIYRTSVESTSTSEMVSISLPLNPKYALQLDQKYQWYFKAYCGETISEVEYFYVDAWIKKVELTSELKTQLNSNKNKTQDYFTYRNHNIWYDAINSLDRLLQANPQDQKLKAEWNNLIQSVDLLDPSFLR